MNETMGDDDLPFWDYALMFADQIEVTNHFRYAIVRSGWEHLDANTRWTSHD